MKPSNFIGKEPLNSVFKKYEVEIVAMNIIIILKRTGDNFRLISWREYKKERIRDGDFSEYEKRYFDMVKGYFSSYKKIKSFSPYWNI